MAPLLKLQSNFLKQSLITLTDMKLKLDIVYECKTQFAYKKVSFKITKVKSNQKDFFLNLRIQISAVNFCSICSKWFRLEYLTQNTGIVGYCGPVDAHWTPILVKWLGHRLLRSRWLKQPAVLSSFSNEGNSQCIQRIS